MTQNQQTLEERKPKSNIHWPSVGLFALSALTILFAWGSAAAHVTNSLLQVFDRMLDFETLSLNLAFTFTNLITGVLVLPAAVYSLARIMGKSIDIGGKWKSLRRVLHPRWLILVYPLVLGGGYFANQLEDLHWLALPPLHALALAIPPVWVAWVGFRRLRTSTPQRAWGVFNIGFVVGPLLIVVFELFVILAFVIITAVFLVMNPDVLDALELFAESYAQQRQFITPAEVEQLFPILNSKIFVFGLLTFLSVLVPIIEEAIKPIGAWFLIRRKLTPAEGFVAGVISGAGYAMFESLRIPIERSDWLYLILGRTGASIMHIFTAGIIGYTLALAWKEKRYILLGAGYLLGIVVHGLWNAFAVVSTFATFQHEGALLPPFLEETGLIGLGVLALAALMGLALMNQKLRKAIPQSQDEG